MKTTILNTSILTNREIDKGKMKSLLSAYREAKKNNFKDCAELVPAIVEVGQIYCDQPVLYNGASLLKVKKIDSDNIYFEMIIYGDAGYNKGSNNLYPFSSSCKFYTLK